MDAYKEIVDDGIAWAQKESKGGTPEETAKLAVDRLAVEFGSRILKIIPGRVSTEVDARLSYDQQASLDKARSIIAAYEKLGVERNRILVKLASTWEGIKAAEQLEKRKASTAT